MYVCSEDMTREEIALLAPARSAGARFARTKKKSVHVVYGCLLEEDGSDIFEYHPRASSIFCSIQPGGPVHFKQKRILGSGQNKGENINMIYPNTQKRRFFVRDLYLQFTYRGAKGN